MPRGLPPGASDLREAHDLDNNRQWGLFNFPPAEADALRRLLRANEIALGGLTCEIPRRVEWWPVVLRGRIDATRVEATGIKAYRAASADLVFLVNWQQGRAYYWSAAEAGI